MRAVRGSILVVDDSAVTRARLSHALADHVVHEAADVDGALDTLRATPVDLVVLDLLLPGTGGMALLRRWHDEPSRPSPAVIVVSALDDEAVRVEALRLGAADFVAKPFSVAELSLRVAHVLERQALLQELRARVDDLENTANTDALTGCRNRRAFDAQLERLWGERAPVGEQVGLVLLDLDHLKDVNDDVGHGEGDRVLKAVGATLDASCRAGERLFRIGGDEFAVLLLADEPSALLAARRFHGEVRAAGIRITRDPGIATVSVGVAAGPSPVAPDPTALLAAADRALYVAKRRRDTVA